MSPWIIIAIALLLIVFVLRVIFKITGLIIKLVILAGIGFLIWWLFSGI
jgi:hypothetical protein